jgi:ATP-dependent Clp protease ATP-binding subunit ClpC
MNHQNESLQSAFEFNSKGNELYNQGKFLEARDYYQKAIEQDVKFSDGFYNLGLVYQKLHDEAKAKEHFQKAIDIRADYAEAYNQIGILHYDAKRFDEAEKNYRKALQINDKLHYAYYNLSLIEGERGNLDKKYEYIEKSLKIKPNYALSLNEMGNLYYNKSDYEKAKDYYEKAFRANPDDKFVLYNLGLMSEIYCEYEQALNFYEKSLEKDPADEMSKRKLAEITEKINSENKVLNKNGKASVKNERKESYIEKIGRNLNQLASEGKLNDVIGREKEISTIFEILFKRFKNNPILIGQPGVGKTAIVEGIAKKIVDGTAPEQFKDKNIVEINTGLLIAGTKYRGEFEAKVKKILDDARENPATILFIDEIHSIIGAGRVEGGNLDIAQMLKPALQNGEITCIGATTTQEFRKYIESDPALARRFYPVVVAELSPEQTKEILLHNMKKANEYYRIQYTDENIAAIVELSAKYLKKRYFPDKAIDIFEKLAARISLKGRKEIETHDIKEIISEMTGIQFVEEDHDEVERLSNLEDNLKKVIFGQDEAIHAICNHLRITKRRLDLRPERPDGVFLLTGPTGVGKTFMAKCLAQELYGDQEKVIQLNMSEFSEGHSVSKLIGAPPGYVGYDDAPPLCQLIMDNPTSILLLDEIEKAHLNVVRLFLQILEEGKMVNAKGEKIYFSDVTIIMTSNALHKEKLNIGFLKDETHPQKTENVVNALTRFFPKEFLNRIDEIIIFNPLSREDIKNILQNNVFSMAHERFAQEGIGLIFEASILDKILTEGYSVELGARNIQRTFETLVLADLVKFIYDKKIKEATLKLSFDSKKEDSNSGLRIEIK